MSLLKTARSLRDDHQFLSGRKITFAPRVLLGAAENPFAQPVEFRAQRLAKKIAAGAQFIQTQYCYDVAMLRHFMQHVEQLGLLDKVFILVGVGPFKSAKAAEWIRTHVPGVHIPDAVIARLKGAGDQALEGRRLCTDLVQEIRPRYPRRAPDGLQAGETWPRSSIVPACSPGACPGTGAIHRQSQQDGLMTDFVISSATREVVLGFDRPFVMIGERINPTVADPRRRDGGGEFQSCRVGRAGAASRRGPHAGCECGPRWPRPAILAQTIKLVQSITDVPLSMDSIVAAPEWGWQSTRASLGELDDR